MILKYVSKVSALLRDNDEARVAFERETKNLEEYLKKDTSNKCFYAALVGVLVSTFIYGGVFYYANKTNKIDFLKGQYQELWSK